MLILPHSPIILSAYTYNLFHDVLVPSQARVPLLPDCSVFGPLGWRGQSTTSVSSTVHEFKPRDGRILSHTPGIIRERGRCRFLSNIPNWVWWFLLLLAVK
ncbi:hypothetical protein E4T42_01314 [Aureobasidium subglaciale]|nr:hypothetical protein E4T42_01314 [Aureobasidium subglaciale]